MFYKTVEFKKRIDGTMYAHFQNVPGDREEIETKPNPCGFYDHPQDMPDQEAFVTLKQAMIDNYKNEIKALEKLIASVENVQYKN